MATIHGRRDDDGSILPWTAIFLAVTVAGAMVLYAVVDGSVRQARAQIAADAGALAAVAVAHGSPDGSGSSSGQSKEGQQMARLLAEENGASLVDYRWEVPGNDLGELGQRPFRVTVVADYLGVKAVATAERSIRARNPRRTSVGKVDSAPGWATPLAGYADLELGAG